MSAAQRWQGFRPLPADIQERLALLRPLLAAEGVLVAYLFGSLAAGRPAHDVDLALLLPEGQPAYRLREAITDCLGTERVDVIDLRLASPQFRFEVLRTGRPLYARDEAERFEYEMATVRLYHDTAHLRRLQGQLLKERMAAWLSSEKASKTV